MPDSFKTSQDTASKQAHFSQRFKTFLEKKGGKMSFVEFMRYSLYDEVDGYYSAPDRKRVGKEGDFITSVSVGQTFTRLIIERVKHLLKEGKHSSFSFMELGPETGDFLEDFLTLWDETDGDLLEYIAIEHSPEKRQVLKERFSEIPQVNVLGEIPTQDGLVILLANEILDAFPVHLIEKKSEGWAEVWVSLEGEELRETYEAVGNDLTEKVLALPENLPIGYRTEICTGFSRFFSDLADKCRSGHFMFIDYFLSETEYYASYRSEGTLQTYSKHQKNASPYMDVGKKDLSCHVNFHEVERAAEASGFTVLPVENQGTFLTRNAQDWLLSLTPTDPNFQKTINEFKTLTMPQLFGAKFQVLEMRLDSVR